ncbi:MAG: Rrf2 family transcriptional regulator [Roseiflexaceae bacterium]|nr:Rrf2 family transcriptional regulator [Roseiflexaceae bacterium]
MGVTSHFAIAVHALTALAISAGQTVTSEDIAESVNTNPSFIRRVLGDLRRAGLISSQVGNGGGLALIPSPTEITLLDIYTAVENESLFSLPLRPPNKNCPVGGHIQPVLTNYFSRAEAATHHALQEMTLADVVADIKSHHD